MTCPIGNLVGNEQGCRLWRGVVSFIFALGVAVAFLKLGVSLLVRGVLIVLFFFASNGVYIVLFKTCGFMVIQGKRVTSDGAVEKIANPAERARNWNVGRTVILSAVGTALVLTGLVVILPVG